jgi:hypothetical protein
MKRIYVGFSCTNVATSLFVLVAFPQYGDPRAMRCHFLAALAKHNTLEEYRRTIFFMNLQQTAIPPTGATSKRIHSVHVFTRQDGRMIFDFFCPGKNLIPARKMGM